MGRGHSCPPRLSLALDAVADGSHDSPVVPQMPQLVRPRRPIPEWPIKGATLSQVCRGTEWRP